MVDLKTPVSTEIVSTEVPFDIYATHTENECPNCRGKSFVPLGGMQRIRKTHNPHPDYAECIRHLRDRIDNLT